MELLPGGTLEGGSLTHAEAAAVADGLAYAHARGVVHRDLKPANLLRAVDGSVKIADFGIARAVEETMVTQVGTVLGTLRYLAPEQAEGRVVGPEADVYSLGVVLDELLDPKLPDLVRRCCEPDPRDRLRAAEVAEALGSPRTVVVERRQTGGVRLTEAVLAVCAVAAIVAAVVLLTHRHRPPTKVEPVAHATTAAQEARNLESWLKRYSN
jgi:serine/threonine protein kinase